MTSTFDEMPILGSKIVNFDFTSAVNEYVSFSNKQKKIVAPL